MPSKNKPKWDDLTDYERECYANQDYVSQGEVCLPHFENITNEDDIYWGSIRFNTSVRLKSVIILLHKDGLDSGEIGYHVACSTQYIRQVVAEYKNPSRK